MKKGYTPEQIINKLREAEILLGQGDTIAIVSKKLGVIGLGRVGRALVPKAKGFGIRVCAYDPYLADDIFEMMGVDRCYELEHLLEQSDYVSIHTPLTSETRGLIGERELGCMKQSAVIVNTARGPIWD